MSIPIIIFLGLYLLLIISFIIFSMFLLYHAFRFGVANVTNMMTIVIYLTVSIVLLVTSYYYISQIDWSLRLEIF